MISEILENPNLSKEAVEIVNLWIDIDELELPIRNPEVHKRYEALNIILQLNDDSAEPIAMMLVKRYLDIHIQTKDISIADLLSAEAKSVVDLKLEKVKKLYSLIENEQFKTKFERMQKNTKDILSKYGVEQLSDCYVHVDNEGEYSEMKVASIQILSEMNVLQFTKGETICNESDTAGAGEFIIDTDIYKMKHMDEMLEHLISMGSGVCLGMLSAPSTNMHRPQVMVGVRNGENLLILQLFNHYSLDHIKKEIQKDILENAPHRSSKEKIGDVNFYSNKQTTVQIMMLLEEIGDYFFGSSNPALFENEILYTYNMMVGNFDIVKEAEKRGVTIGEYPALKLKPITLEDIKLENIKDIYDVEPTGRNERFIEQYKHAINPEAFQTENAEVLKLAGDKAYPQYHILNSGRYAFEVIEQLDFGGKSADEIRVLRLHSARYNLTKMISVATEKDYMEKGASVESWFKSAVEKNIPNLLRAFAEGEFIAIDDSYEERINVPSNIFTEVPIEEDKGYPPANERTAKFAHYEKNGVKHLAYSAKCYLNRTASSIVGVFRPQTAQQVALLCNVEIADLPPEIRQWESELVSRRRNTPIGNGRIENYDAMDSWYAFKDGWCNLDLEVYIYLSKRAVASIKKDYEKEKVIQ